MVGLFIFGCINGGGTNQNATQIPNTTVNGLTVTSLLSDSSLFDQTVTVIGVVSYDKTYCTEMYCEFADDCIPEDEMECNTCGSVAYLSDNNNHILLVREDGSEFDCSGQEVLVCDGETKYKFDNCELEDESNYKIIGTLKHSDENGRDLGFDPYYFEVKNYELTE